MENNRTIIKNGSIIGVGKRDIAIVGEQIAEISEHIQVAPKDKVIDAEGLCVAPAFVDVHVHLREPGYGYKERIATGTMAAARGGYSTVCSMPNLNPVPDSVENLQMQLKLIEEQAVIHVYPYGSITVGQKGEELADMGGMAPDVIGFSDDGRGVQSDEMMREAMKRAKALNKPIVAHCEVNELLRGGYIHDGEYAKAHDHAGICSESEWGPIKRDIELVRETGCKYHVCHISTKESVDLIRKAKKDGLDITCETAPHYLILNDNDLQEDGRFKMNPPIRSEEDRLALIEGIKDGTIDMIATDHAPHSAEEKADILIPFVQTRYMINEAVSLEVKFTETGLIKLQEAKRTDTKDRYMTFGMFCVFGDKLYNKYCKNEENENIDWDEVNLVF